MKNIQGSPNYSKKLFSQFFFFGTLNGFSHLLISTYNNEDLAPISTII